jgi:hypothetical protein
MNANIKALIGIHHSQLRKKRRGWMSYIKKELRNERRRKNENGERHGL